MGLKDKTGCSRPFNGAEGESHSGRPRPFNGARRAFRPVQTVYISHFIVPAYIYPRALTGADKCNPARRPAPDARLVRGYLSAPIFLDLRLKICFNI